MLSAKFIILLSLVTLLIQCFYWLALFKPLYHHLVKIRTTTASGQPPVSIIICARNEVNNLRKNLPLILDQNYPVFEVVVVNDGSTDGSGIVVEAYREKYANLKIYNLADTRPGKKDALVHGINNCTYEHLLVTDADCFPSSIHWIKNMMADAGSNTLVLGYAPYYAEKGLLNLFIRYETLLTAIQYGSFALAGMAYMGVGRNLGYHKNLMDEAPFTEKDYSVASGDDDLLVNKMIQPRVVIQFTPDAHMYSASKSHLKSYVAQKRRHVSSAPHYRLAHQWKLAVYGASHWLFYFLILLLFYIAPPLAVALIILRLCIFYPIFRSIAIYLHHARWITLPQFLLMEFLMLVYYPLLICLMMKGEREEW